MVEKFQILGSVLFALAVIHTFAIRRFQHLATRYPEGSVRQNLFHLLGEVEVVFGIWAGLLILLLTLNTSHHDTVYFLETLNFTEPLFVFVIMCLASTKPVIELATSLIGKTGETVPVPSHLGFYLSVLILGPLLGSLITEPAAMTVTALILKHRFFDRKASPQFMYTTLAVLFVNISIGGVLTNFAAPPVIMVSSVWGWDSAYMFDHFGWKAVIAVTLNALLATWFLRNELKTLYSSPSSKPQCPLWVSLVHLFFILLVVANAHYPILFVGLFLFFLGFATITREFQEVLKIKESLLIAFFLGGLVVLGAFQSWWLKPILESLQPFPLFGFATLLTGFVDNAALTYLGSQVTGITQEIKYALVAGSVVGGGLTVIANAPNPAGFSILNPSFGKEGISPIRLLLSAIVPTVIAMACFWAL